MNQMKKSVTAVWNPAAPQSWLNSGSDGGQRLATKVMEAWVKKEYPGCATQRCSGRILRMQVKCKDGTPHIFRYQCQVLEQSRRKGRQGNHAEQSAEKQALGTYGFSIPSLIEDLKKQDTDLVLFREVESIPSERKFQYCRWSPRDLLELFQLEFAKKTGDYQSAIQLTLQTLPEYLGKLPQSRKIIIPKGGSEEKNWSDGRTITLGQTGEDI